MGTKEKKIYTIEDVSRELGVSKSTVSRALSGKGRISGATRERVQQFIMEHDYRPNAAAKSLANKKTYNLALILPTDYAATEYSFFKECMNGICEAASEENYDILISMAQGEDLSRISRLVLNRKVDGVILSRATESVAMQAYLRENGMPYLVIGPCPEDGSISVDNQNEEASCEMTEWMLERGMKRIALLGGRDDYRVTKSRYQGYRRAHEKKGIVLEESLFFHNVENYLSATEAVEKALEARVDGILCMDDFICNLALGCLREKGICIPEECSLASLYDSRQMEFNEPPVTSVRFDTTALGRMACRRLLRLLGEEPEQQEIWDSRKTGESCAQERGYQVIVRESTK